MEENKSIEKADGKVIAIRNQNVILDRDVAELYGVETRTVNQAVKRNIERFPIDYMFELTAEEYENLKSQNVISSWGGSRQNLIVRLRDKIYLSNRRFILPMPTRKTDITNRQNSSKIHRTFMVKRLRANQ